MARTLEYQFVGNLFVVAAFEPPSDADWARAMEALAGFLKANGLASLRTIVFSDGNGPNAKQRATLNDLLHKESTPVAVISANLAARAIIAPLSFFNRSIKLVAPDRVGDALAFLGLPAGDLAEVLRIAQEWNRGAAKPLAAIVAVRSV
jgi:hypothetical protein